MAFRIWPPPKGGVTKSWSPRPGWILARCACWEREYKHVLHKLGRNGVNRYSDIPVPESAGVAS